MKTIKAACYLTLFCAAVFAGRISQAASMELSLGQIGYPALTVLLFLTCAAIFITLLSAPIAFLRKPNLPRARFLAGAASTSAFLVCSKDFGDGGVAIGSVPALILAFTVWVVLRRAIEKTYAQSA